MEGASIENGLILRPVKPEECGEGLPYAPINWPNAGDNWSWKAGRRVIQGGYFKDRYLYPPKHLHNRAFRSKSAVEKFIKDKYPGRLPSFKSSFSWRILADCSARLNGEIEGSSLPSEVTMSDGVSCKAGNTTCNSLVIEAEDHNIMPCDLCCIEPRFCVYCSCILCYKSIDLDHGGYSYIKCEATAEGGYICGHVAHLSCGLRAYTAGTVGGQVGLDAEYHCRRCDSRRDLISHATKLIQICKSVESREDVEKILNVGVCILRGSEKTSAKELLNRIEWCMTQLKCGTSLEEIWNAEKADVAGDALLEVPMSMDVDDVIGGEIDKSNSLAEVTESFNFRKEYERIDDEIDDTLRILRMSQEREYRIAEDTLNEHQRYLKNLLEQLEKERTEVAHDPPGNDTDTIMNYVLDRMEQVKQAKRKMKELEKIKNGFGKMPKDVLNQHFGMNIDD
ncbi:hypothetical protein ACFE04_013588 [Oxalis oulophora]